MNLAAFIYLFLTLIKLSYSKQSDQCSKSNTLWYSIKYPYIDLLKSSSAQSSSFTCPQISPQSCCSSEVSKAMSSVSELKLKGFAEEKLESLVMMLSNDSYDLMDIYIKDLEKTKNDLNHLFSTTYGYNYKVHKIFFFTWFNKLKLYMQGKVHNIGQLLDNFFLEMAQKIVGILVAEGSTPEIKACHTTRLIESKPYQDTDVLLKKKIIRSYPPARLLANGIAVGRDVFGELMKNIAPSAKCTEQFNNIFHCMLCQGLTIKPCSQTCITVMDHCFGSFKSSDMKKLDRMFTRYIKTLIQLAGKLDNPFNFHEVNNKMNVQISTAIMNVQTMYPNVKEQIKAKCQGGGGLPISRKKRQASKEFYNWQNANNNNNNNNQAKPWWEQTLAKNMNEENKEKKDFSNYQSKPNDALTPFARKIKMKYKALENYFKNQKAEFCSTLSTVDTTTDCWNGTLVTKNKRLAIVKESKKKNDKIEDVRIKSAVSQLNEITKRINSYIENVNSDPETVVVQDYKVYASSKATKPMENVPEIPFNEKIEGSGDLEGNKLPQPNPIPEKPKVESNEVPPQQPDKTNWQFPAWPEGSGDKDNKLPAEKTQKPIVVTVKETKVTTSSTASSSFSSTKKIIFQSTKPTTPTPNQIPDDEDINPLPPVPLSKEKETVVTVTTVPPVIQPEGSGIQPPLPDLTDKKQPVVLPVITTTPIPDPLLEGSGDDSKPKAPVDKPGPFLPMLPDSSKPITEASIKKPEINPDEEFAPVEGSGVSPESPPSEVDQPPPIQPRNPSTPVIVTEPSTTTKSDSSPPDEYPGKVPSEVWLPGLEGVKNPQKNNQNSTPSGRGFKVLGSVYRITLILLSIYVIV